MMFSHGPINSGFSNAQSMSLITKAAYGAMLSRRASQGIIGYYDFIASTLICFQHTPATQAIFHLLTGLELSFFAGYTALFALVDLKRLNERCNNQGKYRFKPKTDTEKRASIGFCFAQVASDFTVLSATALACFGMISCSGTVMMLSYLSNITVNTIKYAQKLIAMKLTQQNRQALPLDGFKQAHYAINLSLNVVIGLASVSMLTGAGSIPYLSFMALWALTQAADILSGKAKLRDYHQGSAPTQPRPKLNPIPTALSKRCQIATRSKTTR